MKLYVNREHRNQPWGGGDRMVGAFYEHFPKIGDHQVCNPRDPQAQPDVIMIVGLDNDNAGISIDQAIMYKMQLNSGVKIVLRVNENDARKGTHDVDAKLVKVSEFVDASVFVSDWLKQYFMQRGWKCKKNTVIKNGCDREIFKSGEKFNNGKVNIASHHWSSNYLKGFDIYDKLDEFVRERSNEFSFTYIGRHRNTFSRTTKIIEPLYGKALGDELGKYDVYISASRHDPGPNHVIEPIMCELPTYVHKDGGGSVEFAGLDHAYQSWDDLKNLLVAKKFTKNSTSFQDWDSCVKQYEEFLITL